MYQTLVAGKPQIKIATLIARACHGSEMPDDAVIAETLKELIGREDIQCFGDIQQWRHSEIVRLSADGPSVDDQVKQFRLAGRDVFNRYFHVSMNDKFRECWTENDRFSHVESALFDALVARPFGIRPNIYYQEKISEIGVRLKPMIRASAMINRDVDSGSWDHSVKFITPETSMTFVHFFDWDQTDYIDYQYVRAVIDKYPDHPEVIGRHVLIETHNVEFFDRRPSDQTQSFS